MAAVGWKSPPLLLLLLLLEHLSLMLLEITTSERKPHLLPLLNISSAGVHSGLQLPTLDGTSSRITPP